MDAENRDISISVFPRRRMFVGKNIHSGNSTKNKNK